ncbi:MAG TPA: sulfotransferase family 2 domain-containing protein [Acidimicrobiales bacterium]|nr:sulfotransferase family 2 domain-containing protein [Acidimicrobiales bacterium]
MAIVSKPSWFPYVRGPHLTQRVCFFHVPKCGGLSVTSSMRRRYAVSDHLRGRLTSIAAGPSRQAADLQGTDLVEYRKDLLAYFLAREDLRFVTGHVGCSKQIVDAFAGRWKFVTVLRDPVERFVSEYFYNRYKESEHFKTRLSLEEYLDDAIGRFSAQTYLNLFSGLPRSAPDDERIDDALANLSRFDLIGYLDDMSSFRERFAALTGVPLAEVRNNANPAPDYEQQRTQSPAVLSAIESLCAADVELFQRVRKHHA